MAEFHLTPDKIGMNNYSLYDPQFCDGQFCPRDCDRCNIAEEIMEAKGDDPDDG